MAETLKSGLEVVVQELVRLQPDGILNARALDRNVLPTFVTAASGAQVHFSKRALEATQDVASILYSNQTDIHQEIRLEEFYRIMIQGIADCFCSGRLLNDQKLLALGAEKSLGNVVSDAVRDARKELTHYFPAWTMGVEEFIAFQIGPVRFMTRGQWIDSVDFPEKVKVAYALKGSDWKSDLREGLSGVTEPGKVHDLAKYVMAAVRDCPSVLTVTVPACEQHLSRQIARVAARAALDSLALIFESPEKHRCFILHDEPASPTSYSTLVGSSETLWLPGSRKNLRGWQGSSSSALAAVKEYAALIEACGRAISATLDPGSHPAPNLAKRWVTALRWCADGCREPDDSSALAKHATCLDVLASGGKKRGIIELVESQLGVGKGQTLFPRPELSVGRAVAELYDDGRSKILHGTYSDPIRSFSAQRSRAATLARFVLRASVRNWETYSGPDVPMWFRGQASERCSVSSRYDG